MNLRPYQVDTVDRARALLLEGKTKVCLVSPTGSGKTVTGSRIIQLAIERGKRVLFLAHRRELIQQTADKLIRFGIRPGVIVGGERSHPDRPVQVASVQALMNRLNYIGEFDLVVIDECHHVTASNQYAKVLKLFPKAIVIGLTATPWRLDGAGLADVFDGHVISCTPRQLRDMHFLVPVGGFQYEPIDTRGAKVKNGDYDAKSVEQAAMNAKLFGEIVGEWKQHAGGARTVLFACTIRHSQALAQAFCDAGIAAQHLDGETSVAERAAILASIKRGGTKVLCNVNVATEGWDCPELECCILARPTLSTSLYLQMVGRVLRPCGECESCLAEPRRLCEVKPLARIQDHARCLATHGHPYMERDYSPEKSMKASRRESEAGVSRTLTCKKCGSVTSRWPCDACSYVPPETDVEHELAAKRVAIVDTATPAWSAEMKKAQELLKKAAEWRKKSTAEKRHVFDWLVQKHGERSAVGIFRAMSGESEWPPRSWRSDQGYGGARAG